MPTRTALLLVAATVLASSARPPFVPVLAQTVAPSTVAAATTVPAADAGVARALGWPRSFAQGGKVFAVYQPQIDAWTDDKLTARAAVAVALAGADGKASGAEQYGVVWLSARTEVDKVNRLVTLADVDVTKVAFPQQRDQEAANLTLLGAALPDVVRDVLLDHLEANLAVAANLAAANAVPVRNDVPQIIFATEPSLLVLIDGDPAMRPIEGTKLMRVVNTRALIVLHGPTNAYYLHAANGWYRAAAPTGPWTRMTTDPPAPVAASASGLGKSGAIDLLDPKVPEAAPKEPPRIFVSTKPAELIQTAGEPEYTPIGGTSLLYVKNTDSALFMDVTTQRHYVLISGRWFAAPAMNGPWAYVDGKDLPGDFAKIPPDSAKSNVLVSIPGTEQAKQAVVATQIPQTATVKIAEAKLDVVTYDGEPTFVEIAGTTGLAYATNCALPVVRIDADKTYWCVSNGVWFTARSPMGAWTVATVVPPVIYSIPVNSPIHYVTYVRVYGATNEVVYVGYTPGYMGAYVAPGGVVVYGSGYYYPAYVGTVWYGYPPTYGYGAGFACGAVTGFAFGFAAGAILGDCWTHPYWGPCRGFGSVDINTSSVYTNWRGGVTHANRHYEFNAETGKSWSSGSARSFNPYTGRASAGGYSTYFHREDGNFRVREGGATYNPRTGVVHAGGKEVTGNVYDGNVDVDRAGARINTRTDTGVAWKDGDVYAGHDGNVYRHDKDSGWQHHTDSGWESTQRNANLSGQTRHLDVQRQSRSVGQQRLQSYHHSGGGGRAPAVRGGVRRR